MSLQALNCPHCGATVRAGAGGTLVCEFCKAVLVLPGQPPPVALAADALEQELLGILRAGNKIEAIKVCRQRTGLGLREAKDKVEALEARAKGR